MTQTYREQVEECARFVAPRLEETPEWGLILGTGQKLMPSKMAGGGSLSYAELPHFPRATSPSHRGTPLLGPFVRETGPPVPRPGPCL